MSLSFAHVWKQQDSSDLDIILLAPAPAAAQSGEQQEQQEDAARPAMVELARLPAHSILLSNSAVLWCRVSVIPHSRITLSSPKCRLCNPTAYKDTPCTPCHSRNPACRVHKNILYGSFGVGCLE
jgi:hypothetical protein